MSCVFSKFLRVFVLCKVFFSLIDPTRKPPEMYALIESFCLGARRLEIFGRRRPAHPLRHGWVTVLLDDDGDMGAIDRVKPEEKEVDSRASSVAGDGDEEDGMAEAEDSTAVNAAAVEQTKALEGLEGAVLWQREKWEREVREACQAPVGSRVVVVPSTTGEIITSCFCFVVVVVLLVVMHVLRNRRSTSQITYKKHDQPQPSYECFRDGGYVYDRTSFSNWSKSNGEHGISTPRTYASSIQRSCPTSSRICQPRPLSNDVAAHANWTWCNESRFTD